MVGPYDHRAKGYRSGRGRAAIWEELAFDRPDKSIQPQWRVPLNRVPEKARSRTLAYRIGFCSVTSPTTDRSFVAALVPPGTICGHAFPTFTFPEGYEWAYAAWLAVANTFAVDGIARKKVSLNMTLNIVDSLPFPRFSADDARARQLVPLAACLTCTSDEMDDYWRMLAADGWVDAPEPPRLLDEGQRLEVRAGIDVIVARDVFGLTPDEMEFMLSTFDLAERYEIERWGEFRSRRLILEGMEAKSPASAVA